MNHLHDPSYLLSPIQTIANVRNDTSSIYDLLDAYVTFSSRVRSCAQHLQARATPLPALATLIVYKDDVIRTLRRDICLAHVDPLLTSSVDVQQHVRNSSLLCNNALCVLGTIFRYPAFHPVFPEHDLSILLGGVLDITLSAQLPLFNAAKTYSLSLWTLTCHRLPETVVCSRRDEVSAALQRSLDGTRQPCNFVLDGLKAISHTIEHYPSVFLDPLSPLLPLVITHLHCESSELRLHSSIVLGKFANALAHQTDLSLTRWKLISSHIMSFLESYCDESQTISGSTTFLRTIAAAFALESITSPPAWIFAVLASFIVLCGPTLYTKPAVLRFILQALAIPLTHERSVIRALYPHVWRCFVWTFSQMLPSAKNVEPTLISSAFYVIKQEVSGGIGVALVNVLLSDQTPADRFNERAARVSQALLVIKAMVQTDCSHTRREGFVLLQALTDGARFGHLILLGVYEVPASVLLNGAVVGAEWSSLPSTIQSIPKVPVTIHWLEETEIAQHYQTLLETWKNYAAEINSDELDSAHVEVWLSILLACSHQLEYGRHDTTTTEVLKCTVVIIVEFLPSVASGDSQPDWGSWDVQDQVCSLTFINQLWSAMRKAFVAFSLTEPAALLLTSILKYAFHVLDHSVRTLWGRLCADLMITASPAFLRGICDLPAPQLVIHSQRELWGVVATSLPLSDLDFDWMKLVKFLAMPVCVWVLSEPELEAWGTLFRNTITLSDNPAEATELLIRHYFQGKEVETWESILAVLSFMLTCVHEHGSFPTGGLLSLVDSSLIVSYSRTRHAPDVLAHSLKLLNVTRRIIVSAQDKVMHVLRALCGALCLWIEDHDEVMSDDEFNSVAVSLYCETLDVAKSLPLSIQSLQVMEDFLASAFSRIPTPAIAPFAFERFWRATYYGREEFYDRFPARIKSCLACFVAAYGSDLADGLPLTTESQSLSISYNPQAYLSTNHQSQLSGEFSSHASPLLPSINAGTRAELSDKEFRQQQLFTGQDDTSFLISTPDNAPQPTVLRQMQQYLSEVDPFFLDISERSTSSPRMPNLPFGSAIPSPHFPEKTGSVTSCAPNVKRELADREDAPQKRRRTPRDTLRYIRKLVSEPVGHDITPIDAWRMNSEPLKRRKVFDGVELPTFREVLRRKRVHAVDTTDNVLSGGQCLGSTFRMPSECTQRTPPSVLHLSVGSNEDDLDWENFRVDVPSSGKYHWTESDARSPSLLPLETDVDESVLDIYPSSPPRMGPTSATQSPTSTNPLASEHDDELPSSGSSLQKGVSRGESSPPTLPSLERVKTTSARLDALRDIYSSVANCASQIPMSELLQATRLVRQIGAILTEQVDKKMSDPR